MHREIQACLHGEFQVFRLDRIEDELNKCLAPKVEVERKRTIAVGLRRQVESEVMVADNDALHVGLFEDLRRADVVVISVFGIHSELSIGLATQTRRIVSVRHSRFEHSGFVWRLKKAKVELKDLAIEVRPAPADSASDLLDVLLSNPEIDGAFESLDGSGRMRTQEPEPEVTVPPTTRPQTRELWKALIRAEEATLPTVEIAGPIERDHLSGAVRIPYSTTGEPLDFDPEDSIEVLEEVEGELRKIGELNTRETTLTELVVERPYRIPNRIGVALRLRSQQDRASFVRR